MLTVGILGATGAVGQRFVALLANHPWFRIGAVMASERSVGKVYGDAVQWHLPAVPGAAVREMCVTPCTPDGREGLDFVFSGLPAEEAVEIEPLFAARGIPVVSNTRSHRMDPRVPLVIPEVNAGHLAIIPDPSRTGDRQGFIVTNPNCATSALALALDPIHRRLGVRKVMVVTAQAVSGAGFPGLSVMSILDNAIPYISGEEPKLETEPCKIFGCIHHDQIMVSDMVISAACTRVAVRDGHLMHVSVELNQLASRDEIIACWDDYISDIHGLGLPSQPERSVEYLDVPDRPQPLLDRDRGQGMTVTVGRLRECAVLQWKFAVLGHNTIRGAAGGAILLAELLTVRGWFPRS
ncbi:aspartate-semialdehyde dehydrogenase [bacterium]|nr:aspartate-semialdehyde dehydrogenase [candidate division CSSED10-310 bacterium]